GATAAPEETFWAVRRLFESLARTQPLVVDLDDIQWAEPTFVDLIEHVADWTRDAPVLLLCSARPDLLDARPAWGGGKRNATSIELEPLSTDETQRFVEELLAGVPKEVADRIAAVAEGIPLFVEHLVAMLVEDATLVPDSDGWVARGDLASLAVPPTVTALIEARLERLPADELAVLEYASVEGKGFHRGALLALSSEGDHPNVSVRLTALVRRDLIRAGAALLGRADPLLSPSASERAPILLDLGVLHEREGRYEEALSALREAERFGRATGDIGTVARAVARRQFVRSHVEDTAQSEMMAEAEALLPALEAAGD